LSSRFYFFFFSSRRRHTRFSRDWSSDVCSSDLTPFPEGSPLEEFFRQFEEHFGGILPMPERQQMVPPNRPRQGVGSGFIIDVEEIGRASCRERRKRSVCVGERMRELHRRVINTE